MTTNQLNKYIERYLEEDKTKSAIMLTGDWGSGKSYYIKHELLPYLKKEDKNRCVIVSLYGLKDISEISKSIYLEVRVKAIQCKSEAGTTGKMLAKTVAKGVTSFFGIDLSASEEDMQKLYESVDLSEKLIIFEDLERSQINILDLLGYVNNLVEQDGIKVLLVANENEILEYEEKQNEANQTVQKVLTKKSQLYLKTKEKTVSDTISFDGNYLVAIKNIVEDFKNDGLECFLDDQYIEEIYELLVLSKNGNLRTFIFACQKTSDIFKIIEDLQDFEIKKNIFYSIILFAKHIKAGAFPKWDGTNYLSTDLGNANFPLYHFCYDYIRWQEFDINNVAKTFQEHKRMKLYQHHSNDPDAVILYNYYLYTEDEVLHAIKSIEEKLVNPESISFYDYSKLAYYLVACHMLLGVDYSVCKTRMINNIKEKGDELEGDLLFLSIGELESDKATALFDEFKEEILNAIDASKNVEQSIIYEPDNIAKYYKHVAQNRFEIRSNHKFISKFDIDKLLTLIFDCTAEQIHDLRGILFAVYRDSHKGNFIEEDVDYMLVLKEKIESKLEDGTLIKDRILRLQMKWLCENLQKFANQLS